MATKIKIADEALLVAQSCVIAGAGWIACIAGFDGIEAGWDAADVILSY